LPCVMKYTIGPMLALTFQVQAECDGCQSVILTVPERTAPYFSLNSSRVKQWSKRFRDLGYQLDFAFYPDRRMPVMVDQGFADGILAVHSSSALPLPSLTRVNSPYIILEPALYGLANSDSNSVDVSSAHTVVTFLGSSITDEAIPEGLRQHRRITASSLVQSARLVQSGRASLLMMDYRIFDSMVEKDPALRVMLFT